MKKKKSSWNSCAATSVESREKSNELAARLCQRIIELARRSRERGITINQAQTQISDHKSSSVSPRFSELVRRGYLVRVLLNYGPPTTRSPRGIARYLSRYDEETRRKVMIHWLPEFAPKINGTCSADGQEDVSSRNTDDDTSESGPTQAVYL